MGLNSAVLDQNMQKPEETSSEKGIKEPSFSLGWVGGRCFSNQMVGRMESGVFVCCVEKVKLVRARYVGLFFNGVQARH